MRLNGGDNAYWCSLALPWAFLGVLFSVTLLLAAQPVVAGSVSDTVEPARFGIVAVPPWGYAAADGEVGGTLVTLTEAIESLSGIPAIYYLRPQRRVLRELSAGEVDFAYLFESPEADRVAVDLGAVVTTRFILATLAENTGPLSLEDLSGEPLAYIRGTHYGNAFAKADKIQKIAVDTLAQGIEMLALGRVQAVVASDQAMSHTIKSLDMEPGLFRIQVIANGRQGRLYMSKKASHPEYGPRIRDALQQLWRDGRVQLIFQVPETETSTPR